MKRVSEDNYHLKCALSANEVRNRLSDRTLKKNSLTMVSTDLDFIGRIQENSFSIIDSFFPTGVACVMSGELKGNLEIHLTTSLHRGFRVLFTIWAIGFALAFIILGITQLTSLEFLGLTFVFLIAVSLFRLFIHGVYVIARNRGVNKLKRVLELINS